MSKIDSSLFSGKPTARPDEACPECGRPLQLRHGKHGAFLGCSAYPDCDYLRPLKVIEHDEDVEKPLEGSVCPLCDHTLAIRKGRYGLFIGCSHYPACHYVADINDQGNSDPACPVCEKGHLVARTSRYGKRFYACDAYPGCRYIINDKPVAQRCPECGFGILAERKGHLYCPKKGCGYQQ